jgi:FkbM family methyltransferase
MECNFLGKGPKLMNDVLHRIRELAKSITEADFLPNLMGGHVDAVVSGKMPLVLFGAGSAGESLCRALKIHGIDISCFCDNNPLLVGTEIAGRRVIPAIDLVRNYLQGIVVISTSPAYAQQIYDQLTSMGFPADRVITPPFEPLLYYTNLISQYSSSKDHLHNHAEELQAAYALLADQKSKDIFIRRVALFCSAFDYSSFNSFIDTYADLHSAPDDRLFSAPRYDENYFYFNSDFFPIKEQEVFANVGALVGECAVEFARTCKTKKITYKEIINFEPDPENFCQLVKNTEHLPNVRCIPCALWSQNGRMNFSPEEPGSSRLSGDGALEIDVACMDEMLPDTEVTLVKMDVEGAEVEALIGATKTIARCRPKLAISLYHKRDDIFKIPLLLNKICPEYKFYIRHHATNFSETVLYAIADGETCE